MRITTTRNIAGDATLNIPVSKLARKNPGLIAEIIISTLPDQIKALLGRISSNQDNDNGPTNTIEIFDRNEVESDQDKTAQKALSLIDPQNKLTEMIDRQFDPEDFDGSLATLLISDAGLVIAVNSSNDTKTVIAIPQNNGWIFLANSDSKKDYGWQAL